MLFKQPYQMTQYFLKTIIEREKVKKNEETQHEKEGKIEDGDARLYFFFFGHRLCLQLVFDVFNNFLKEKKGWDTYAACPVCV